jgi:hypothetical protein
MARTIMEVRGATTLTMGVLPVTEFRAMRMTTTPVTMVQALQRTMQMQSGTLPKRMQIQPGMWQ